MQYSSVRKFFLPLVLIFILAVSITLSACNNSDDDSGNSTTNTTAVTLSGIAATGAAIVGETVTVKDFQGNTVTGTTGNDGSFKIELTQSFQPPFLLQVSNGSGNSLYSVIDISESGTVNIHPFSDLIAKILFETQGEDLDTVFDSLSDNSLDLTESQINQAKSAVKTMVTVMLENYDIDVDDFDMISSAFDADSTGFDALLDDAAIEDGEVEVYDDTTGTKLTCELDVDADTGTISMTITTTLDGSDGETTIYTETQIVFSDETDVDDAVAGANETLSSFMSTINDLGTQIDADDLAQFYHTDYLDAGLDKDGETEALSDELSEAAVTVTTLCVDHIVSFDETENVLTAVVNLVDSTTSESEEWIFKLEDDAWLVYGNQKYYSLKAGSYMEKQIYDGDTTENKYLNIEAYSCQDILVSASFTGGDYTSESMYSDGEEYQLYYSSVVDSFPTAGTKFVVTVETSQDGTTSQTVRSNATTTEFFDMSGPSGHTLSDANLGGTLSLSWELPSTFTIKNINIEVRLYNASQEGTNVEANETLTSTSTSATVSMPSTVNGASVDQAYARITITGTNGEQTVTEWYFAD